MIHLVDGNTVFYCFNHRCKVMWLMFFQLTPCSCSPIQDGRMEQFVEPCHWGLRTVQVESETIWTISELCRSTTISLSYGVEIIKIWVLMILFNFDRICQSVRQILIFYAMCDAPFLTEKSSIVRQWHTDC